MSSYFLIGQCKTPPPNPSPPHQKVFHLALFFLFVSHACSRLAMGNVRDFLDSRLVRVSDPLGLGTDTISPRAYSHHWAPKIRPLLCAEAEAQRNHGLCHWYYAHPLTVAACRFPHRTLWNFCPLWRLFRNCWLLCWQHPRHRPVYPEDIR